MSIQGKPDQSPAIQAFRDGKPLEQVHQALTSGTEAAPAPEAATTPATMEHEIQLRAMKQRISKTLRVSQSHSIYLRDYAAEQSRAKGEKISESDVLDDALTEFFKRRKFPAR